MLNHSRSKSFDYKGLDFDSWNIVSNLTEIQTAGEWILLFGVFRVAESKIIEKQNI